MKIKGRSIEEAIAFAAHNGLSEQSSIDHEVPMFARRSKPRVACLPGT
jgi:hypothetical protein